VLSVFGAPGQLRSLAGQEHGRSVRLAVIGAAREPPDTLGNVSLIVLATTLQSLVRRYLPPGHYGYARALQSLQ
jgi:hypothetical protein